MNTINTNTIEMMNSQVQDLGSNIFIYPAAEALTYTKELQFSQCAALAKAMYEAIDNLGDMETYLDIVSSIYHDTVFTVYGKRVELKPIDDIQAILIKARLIDKKGNAGKNLVKLVETVKNPHKPAIKGNLDKERRYTTRVDQRSPLFMAAKEALETTYNTIDTGSLDTINQLVEMALSMPESKLAEMLKDEHYIIVACNELVANGNPETSSEWDGDWRLRLYQKACHGANGQASDLARSLMLLSGVPTTYDVDLALSALEKEMEDMIKGDVRKTIKWAFAQGSSAKAIALVVNGQTPSDIKIKKPFAFIQMAKVYVQLFKHKTNPKDNAKPYIGLAFGLDAKGSGPQIAALIAGDKRLQTACGFNELGADKVADVYALANMELAKKNLPHLERDLVKDCFMAVLYGQGYMTFANPRAYGGTKMDKGILEYIVAMNPQAMMDDGLGNIAYNNEVLEISAKVFHGCIEAAFGEVAKLRRKMKNAHKVWDDELGEYVYLTRTDKAMRYYAPDGAKIQFKEKVKLPVWFDLEDDIKAYLNDNLSAEMVKKGYRTLNDCKAFELDGEDFKAMDFHTGVIDVNYQERTGFVNFIQGNDALLARLIVWQSRVLGCTHIIAIHDCFRVNICDYIDGKLHKAISNSYEMMFGDMPCEFFDGEQHVKGIHNRDIISLYFAGVQDAYISGAFMEDGQRKPIPVKMFTSNGKRIRKLVNGKEMSYWAKNIENNITNTGFSYFFCK